MADISKMNEKAEGVGTFDYGDEHYYVVLYRNRYYAVTITNVGIVGLESKGFKSLMELDDYLRGNN